MSSLIDSRHPSPVVEKQKMNCVWLKVYFSKIILVEHGWESGLILNSKRKTKCKKARNLPGKCHISAPGLSIIDLCHNHNNLIKNKNKNKQSKKRNLQNVVLESYWFPTFDFLLSSKYSETIKRLKLPMALKNQA